MISFLIELTVRNLYKTVAVRVPNRTQFIEFKFKIKLLGYTLVSAPPVHCVKIVTSSVFFLNVKHDTIVNFN